MVRRVEDRHPKQRFDLSTLDAGLKLAQGGWPVLLDIGGLASFGIGSKDRQQYEKWRKIEKRPRHLRPSDYHINSSESGESVRCPLR